MFLHVDPLQTQQGSLSICDAVVQFLGCHRTARLVFPCTESITHYNDLFFFQRVIVVQSLQDPQREDRETCTLETDGARAFKGASSWSARQTSTPRGDDS